MALFGADLKEIVVVGPTGSGKTVMVATMIDRYLAKQQLTPEYVGEDYNVLDYPQAIPTESIKKVWNNLMEQQLLFRIEPMDLSVLKDSIGSMQSREWPARSHGLTTYHVTAEIDTLLRRKEVPIHFLDYSGDAFARYAGMSHHGVSTSPCDPPLEDSLLKASALCLVIDPNSLLPGGASSEDRIVSCQQAIMKVLQNTAAASVAVVFSKSDLYRGLPGEIKTGDGSDCPELGIMGDPIACILPYLDDKNYAFFSVCCVATEVHRRTGQPIPPTEWESEKAVGVHELVRWLVEEAL